MEIVAVASEWKTRMLLLLLLSLSLRMARADQRPDPAYLARHYRLGAKEEPGDFDACRVTWAHAVNSRKSLEIELAGSADFLEADVNLGHVVGNEFRPPVPVMAHPPDTVSDISLDTWLDTVIARKAQKGIKLDFKSLEVVTPSLMILERHANKLNSTIILNADVLPGPVNSSTIPVQMDSFLSLCRRYFPKAVVSIGWTTYWSPIFPPETCHYEWQHVRKMVDAIRCNGYENIYPTFQFPVRGVFASRSIRELQWLLSVVPTSSLIVWSAKFDSLDLKGLQHIRSHFPKYRVYYDIPEPLGEVFRKEAINNEFLVTDLFEDDGSWMTVSREDGDLCSSYTYIRGNAIVFGKSLKTAVLHKKLVNLDAKNNLKITGRVQFFRDHKQASPNVAERQELSIVLADVKLFSKNLTSESPGSIDFTQSDSDVIWSAIDASRLHKFTHWTLDHDTACRTFRLDTSGDRLFEAWTVPCDVLREESFEEAIKSGISEISSRKRLVLPEGAFMFGLVSSGEEYVVAYDLEITGNAVTAGSQTTYGLSVGLLPAVLLSIAVSLFFYNSFR